MVELVRHSRTIFAALLLVLVPRLFGAVIDEQPITGMVTRHYVDSRRLNWARTGPRPVRTAIWYPVDEVAEKETIFGGPEAERVFVPVDVAPAEPLSRRAQKYPLIVMSHGTGGSAMMMMWLGRHLAANGYIVAAVNHHGNTASEKELVPQAFLLYWERPRDLRVALDEILRDPLFAGRIDTRRIGAAGFSLGGYTAIAAAGGRFNQREFDRFCASPARDFTCGPQNEFPEAPARFAALRNTDPFVRESLRRAGASYRDRRIRAVFAIAPALGSGFTARDLRGVRVPVKIVVGAADTVTPPATNAQRYAELIRGAQLTVLPGEVGHYTFLHECTPRGVEILPICRDGAGVERADVHRAVAASALEFFNTTLAQPAVRLVRVPRASVRGAVQAAKHVAPGAIGPARGVEGPAAIAKIAELALCFVPELRLAVGHAGVERSPRAGRARFEVARRPASNVPHEVAAVNQERCALVGLEMRRLAKFGQSVSAEPARRLERHHPLDFEVELRELAVVIKKPELRVVEYPGPAFEDTTQAELPALVRARGHGSGPGTGKDAATEPAWEIRRIAEDFPGMRTEVSEGQRSRDHAYSNSVASVLPITRVLCAPVRSIR